MDKIDKILSCIDLDDTIVQVYCENTGKPHWCIFIYHKGNDYARCLMDDACPFHCGSTGMFSFRDDLVYKNMYSFYNTFQS